MRPFSPFNHRRDRELGDALRDALGPGDHLAFVRRVLASAHGQGAALRDDASSWDVLGAWSAPGLAAAIALTIFAVIGLRGFEPRAMESLGAVAPVTVVTETTRTAPPLNTVDGDFVLASFFEH
jgi:hypothetical protein